MNFRIILCKILLYWN